jgi:hypothetical protein
MPESRLQSLKIKAKLLQKAKQRGGQPFALKDAYELLAKQAGHPSWRAMKESLDGEIDLFPQGASAMWKTWYASYAEAKEHLHQVPDAYLLPYRNQFFICEPHYIELLGISLDMPELTLVGRDWAQPKDQAAWQRLRQALQRPKS